MIRDFHDYFGFTPGVELVSASGAFPDMGARTITGKIKFDGQITPNFSAPWGFIYKGNKYIMPLRKPQGDKDNTSLRANLELTFQHWAEYQLQQKFFFEPVSVAAGTVIPDKYIASVHLNLVDFCDLFAQVLRFYFGDSISIDLDSQTAMDSSRAATKVEISYAYLWDVLIEMNRVYGIRWQIEPNGDVDHYVIKILYGSQVELSHVFEYGFKGGLLKMEQQVQNPDIRNMILGRGCDKNLPYRYFKDADPNNPAWPADPDWIPELALIPFTQLRGATFRSYIRGWKARHYGGASKAADCYAPWAWEKGYNDSTFDPVEFVYDEKSVAFYGELWGALEDNSEVYPSIQERTRPGLGRIDEVVDVEPIISDDYESASRKKSKISDAIEGNEPNVLVKAGKSAVVSIVGGSFVVEAGLTGNFDPGTAQGAAYINPRPGSQSVSARYGRAPEYDASLELKVKKVTVNGHTTIEGLEAGAYTWGAEIEVVNNANKDLWVTVSLPTPKVTSSDISGQFETTWCVWIKNVFGNVKPNSQSAESFAAEVWDPILGDHLGNEAKMIFTSGMLSTSEDYEFVITRRPEYDPSRTIEVEGVGPVPSMWKLTLGKSDAELDSTGLWLPSTRRQAKQGDHYVFIGIELPHAYTLLAEEEIDNAKTAELQNVKEIKPTRVVSLDKIRISTAQFDDAAALIDQIVPGAAVRIRDPRFILNEEGKPAAYETMYIQSVNIEWRESTADSPALIPDVEITLSDKYEVAATTVARMQSDINALTRQIASIGNIEQIVRAIGDKLYLRKDGIGDLSLSPTQFVSLLTSADFRPGMVGGEGWGIFRDANGQWVIETDRLNVRQDLQVNTLVVNQITARGGMIIESAAAMEASVVQPWFSTEEGVLRSGIACYFDSKNGSVLNLFHVDDVALCYRFLPATEGDGQESSVGTIKYYRRRVIAVGSDYIVLSVDSLDIDGNGQPEVGDTIVHFGNYTDSERQYVKVRDVVGGGYERYIEGLDSVFASGREYYFVGRQAGVYGSRPRFFLGDPESFIKYENGKLTICADLEIKSTLDGKPLPEYMASLASQPNLALQTSIVGYKALRYAAEIIEYDFTGLESGQEFTLSFDYILPQHTPSAGAHAFVEVQFGSTAVQAALDPAPSGAHFSATMQAPDYDNENVTRKVCIRAIGLYGWCFVQNLMLQAGTTESPWQPSPYDVSPYVIALRESTSISGGLVLTSMVEVGDSSTGSYVIRAGMNGTQAGVNPVVFWAGGTFEEAKDRIASYAVFLDGTGYMAHDTLRFLESRIEVGEYLRLDNDGMSMVIDGSKRLVVGNETIDGSKVLAARTRVKFPEDVQWRLPGGTTVRYYLNNESLSVFFGSESAPIMYAKEIHIGSVDVGRAIEISSDSPYYAASPIVGRKLRVASACPYLRVELYDGSTRKYSVNIYAELCTDSSGQILYDLTKFHYEPDAPLENAKLRLKFYNRTTNPSNWTNLSSDVLIAPYSSRTPSVVISTPDAWKKDRAILGVNGTELSWGDTHQYQQSGLWGVRVGDHGFRISPDGIFIMTDGESSKSIANYIADIVRSVLQENNLI